MSAAKYANLPDIDTAQDVYETPDVVSTSGADNAYDSDDELLHGRSRKSALNGTNVSNEDLDTSSMNPSEASALFRRAEKKAERRTVYTYPPSPTSDTEPSRQAPLSQRIQLLKAELAALEAEAAEVADPANPQLNAEDAGGMIRDLVGVRGRLEKLSSRKEGRERLIELITMAQASGSLSSTGTDLGGTVAGANALPASDDTSVLAEIDKRVGELEKLVGSSSAALDETSQLPSPLLPLLNRLSAQLTLLTQPRHIDSISRRLKLLLADLERTSGASSGAAAGSRRQPSQGASLPPAPAISPMQNDILPLLTRLSQHLPTLPHILTRLRTLSALHTSAAAFEATLKDLEDEQKKVRQGLGELAAAVTRVEQTFTENEAMAARNVSGLEQRIDSLASRLESLNK